MSTALWRNISSINTSKLIHNLHIKKDNFEFVDCVCDKHGKGNYRELLIQNGNLLQLWFSSTNYDLSYRLLLIY